MIYIVSCRSYRRFLTAMSVKDFARELGLWLIPQRCTRRECLVKGLTGKNVKRCKICAAVYCSKECQTAHWPRHRTSHEADMMYDVQKEGRKMTQLFLTAVKHHRIIKAIFSPVLQRLRDTVREGVIRVVFSSIVHAQTVMREWHNEINCVPSNMMPYSRSQLEEANPGSSDEIFEWMSDYGMVVFVVIEDIGVDAMSPM